MFDVKKIRQDFPMLNGHHFSNNGKPIIYFDNAATTLKPFSVIEACDRYYKNESANSHRGDYDLAFKVDKEVDLVREKIAKFFNAKKIEIVFTSGCSMSMNLVAFGYGFKYLKKTMKYY